MKCPACGFDNKEPNKYQYTPTTIDKLKLFDENDILCCSKCSFGMIERDVSNDLLQSYYSSEYSGKAKKVAETKAVDLKTEYSVDSRSISQLALIKNFVELSSNVTVVEIGPGKGDFLFSMRKIGFKGKLIAFEPQKQAHEFLENLNVTIEKDVFSLQKSNKYKNTVDLVVMSHSLEHFNPGQISEILNGINIMLRKGGAFFCEVPNANIVEYPNSGERVVPHLSFFSIDSLKNFLSKSGFNMTFINTCGDSQFDKDHKLEIELLKKNGNFIFDEDTENGIFRNIKYHDNLKKDSKAQRRKQKLIRIIINFLGKKQFLLLINKIRKYRQKSHYSLIASKEFTYGNDREFIRLIALK